MRIRLFVGSLVAAAVCAGGVLAVNNNAAPKAEPKSVKEVMKLAHKEGLLKKILAGGATDDEKKKLFDLYIDMAEGEAKKGDKAEWKTAANAAALSAGKVVLGREGAIAELTKTSDCKACHDKFK